MTEETADDLPIPPTPDSMSPAWLTMVLRRVLKLTERVIECEAVGWK